MNKRKKSNKYHIYIILFSLILSSCTDLQTSNPTSSSGDTSSENSLSVLTWNVENFPKSGYNTIEYVANIIKNSNSDVIALQEIPNNLNDVGLVALQNLLPDYSFILGEYSNSDISVAFFYKKILEYIDSKEIFTVLDDGYPEYTYPFPRPPLILQIKWEEDDVYIINNHFKCCSESEDIDRRLEASTMLKKYIDTTLQNQKVIILGDLNATLDTQSFSRIIFKNGLLPLAEVDTLIGFVGDIHDNCFSNFKFYDINNNLLSSSIIDYEGQCSDLMDVCVSQKDSILYYTSISEISEFRMTDNGLCIAYDTYYETQYNISASILYLDPNFTYSSIQTINIFDNFISDSLNYIITDMEIAQGHSDYWSYPSYPSHIDHIIITAPLEDVFKVSQPSIQILPLDLSFSSWDDYEFMISDHRPLQLILDH